MRSDIDTLNQIRWTYCVLDEGHLLKKPKTATAKAARRLRSHHILILSGTPIQNRFHELWLVFNFIMPYFLGTEANFIGHFARDFNERPPAWRLGAGDTRRAVKTEAPTPVGPPLRAASGTSPVE